MAPNIYRMNWVSAINKLQGAKMLFGIWSGQEILRLLWTRHYLVH